MENLGEYLKSISHSLKNVQEIRLRTNKPLCIVEFGQTYFLDVNGNKSKNASDGVIISGESIRDIFMKMCQYSIHAYKNQIKEGYITIEGGHRVGIGGKINNNGFSVDEITSLNIRIAGEYPNCSENIVKKLFSSKVEGTILVGSPSSGKTTLLRDMALKLTDGSLGYIYKVTIVDSRNEICGYSNGDFIYNTGANTDVITNTVKSEGIMQAIRVLSPQVIICDEMGNADDVKAVCECLNSGVKVITTVHASDIDEVNEKPQINMLLSSHAFKNAVLLEGAERPTEVKCYGKVMENAENTGDIAVGKRSFIVWNK